MKKINQTTITTRLSLPVLYILHTALAFRSHDTLSPKGIILSSFDNSGLYFLCLTNRKAWISTTIAKKAHLWDFELFGSTWWNASDEGGGRRGRQSALITRDLHFGNLILRETRVHPMIWSRSTRQRILRIDLKPILAWFVRIGGWSWWVIN